MEGDGTYFGALFSNPRCYSWGDNVRQCRLMKAPDIFVKPDDLPAGRASHGSNEFPYTRHPAHDVSRTGVDVRQYAGFGTAAESTRVRYLLARA
jgi:hypothetical protein